MSVFFVNQVGPLAANAGVQNIQNVTAPFSSTFAPSTQISSASGQAARTAIPAASTGLFGLDPMTWLTLISLGAYLYFSLRKEG